MKAEIARAVKTKSPGDAKPVVRWSIAWRKPQGSGAGRHQYALAVLDGQLRLFNQRVQARAWLQSWIGRIKSDPIKAVFARESGLLDGRVVRVEVTIVG